MNNKNSVGRPLKFESIEALQEKIDEYFSMCDNRTREVFYKGVKFNVSDPRPYTVTGLALHLNTNRETILDYENMNHESIDEDLQQQFSDTIKKAKLKIHNYAEESLWTPKITGGVIFNLVNNWNWINKQVVQNQSADGELSDEDEKRIDEELSKLAEDSEPNTES